MGCESTYITLTRATPPPLRLSHTHTHTHRTAPICSQSRVQPAVRSLTTYAHTVVCKKKKKYLRKNRHFRREVSCARRNVRLSHFSGFCGEEGALPSHRTSDEEEGTSLLDAPLSHTHTGCVSITVNESNVCGLQCVSIEWRISQISSSKTPL